MSRLGFTSTSLACAASKSAVACFPGFHNCVARLLGSAGVVSGQFLWLADDGDCTTWVKGGLYLPALKEPSDGCTVSEGGSGCAASAVTGGIRTDGGCSRG